MVALQLFNAVFSAHARRILRRVDENVGGTLVSRPTQKLASKECALSGCLAGFRQALGDNQPDQRSGAKWSLETEHNL